MCVYLWKQNKKPKAMNTITTKADFSKGMKSVEEILNKIEALCFDPEFIKCAAETCKQNGITADEWNNNKMPILMKLASQVVLG
jgi:hypothetical protein